MRIVRKAFTRRRLLHVGNVMVSIVTALTLSLSPFLDVINVAPTPKAEAAYSGKYQRTVEYVLGNGSDTTLRAANGTVYAGDTWNTVKATAGLRRVYLEGTGIKVKNAYLETWHQTAATTTSVGEILMNISVTPGDSGGTDIPVDTSIQSATLLETSGMHLTVVARADVTHVFQQQTDAEWRGGVGVVASLNNRDSSRGLATMKLVITYEEDYSTVAHTAVKTVRFPLDSTTSGDTGSTRAACAVSTNCIFEYRAEMPDLSSNADILDVWFEMHQYVDGAGTATTSIGIAGAAATTTYYNFEVAADAADRLLVHRVATGSPNFVPNATSTIIYQNGASQAVNVVGGEVIVTYRYSTGAATQTETVSYFMDQDTTPVGITKTAFRQAVHIANGGMDVKNLWFRVRTPHSGAQSPFTVYGTVGAAAEQSQAYTLPATNIRTGEAVIYMDLSPTSAGSFSSATTSVAGAAQWQSATGDAQVNVELFVTFTWSGASDGPQTKTNRFFGGNSGVANPTASIVHSFPTIMYAPETVGKTYQSAYLRLSTMHSEATTISVATVTFGVNASTTALAEDTDNEAFTTDYLHQIATSTFTGNTGSTINSANFSWTEKSFMVRGTLNQADEYAFSGELVLTYRVELDQDGSATTGSYQRTVEYVLGSGSDTTIRAANATVYAGNTWNTVKATAGTRKVYLEGSNVKVKNAYLESWFQTNDGTTDVGEIFMNISVSPGDSGGTDIPVNPGLMTASMMDNSGVHFSVVARADVTHVFQQQTDAEWASGVGVVASLNSVDVGRGLSSMKLVITYEEDYSTVAHNSVKTVRFPLDSTTSGDTGSTRSTCAANTNCIFEYRAEMPDLASDADILDVWFEMHQYVDGAGTATTSIGIAGAAATTTYQNFEILNDGADRLIIHHVATGTPNFTGNATSSLIYANGASQAVNTVGGEVIVTYRYSTGAATQTETVSYFMDQDTTAVGNTKTSFSQAIHIANAGMDVKNLWFRVRTPQSAAHAPFTVYGTVGAGAEQSQAYTVAAGTRAGESVIYMDLSPTSAGNFNSATTTVSGATQWQTTTGDAQVNVELFVTFTWSGASGGPQTKTNRFFGGNSALSNPVGAQIHNFPVILYAVENVGKSYQSAYLRLTNMHTETGTIALGTATYGVNASTTALTEDTDTESFTADYLHQIATSTLTGNTGASINSPNFSWSQKSFLVRAVNSAADDFNISGELVLTYRAELAEPSNPELTILHYRWRNDDGSESGAGFMAAEDTAVTTGVYAGDNMRLRFLVSNTGTGNVSNVGYRLEHSSSTCTVWVPVATTANGAHWQMHETGYYANFASTTHSSGLTAPGGESFTSGYALSTTNQTNGHTLTDTQYTEMEYSIKSTSAVTADTVYCFRLTNAGSITNFVYSVQPQITVQIIQLKPVRGGSGNTEDSGSGPQVGGGGAGGGSGGESGGSGSQQGGGGAGGGGGGDSG